MGSGERKGFKGERETKPQIFINQIPVHINDNYLYHSLS